MIKANASDVMTLFGRNGVQNSAAKLRPHVGLHQNALLRKDEWLELDKIVLETAKTKLNGVADLMSRGLVKKLGGLGSKVSAFEQIGEMTAATVSMSVDVPGERDRLEYTQVNIPVPVLYKEFSFDLRDLESARQSGDPLETDHVSAATRVVTESLETMLFSGHAKQLAGYTIQGYTTATNRIQTTAAALGGGDVGTAGNLYKTVTGAITALNAIGFDGPFMIYLASTQYGQGLNLIDPTNARSEISVVKDNIPEVIDIKKSFELTDGHMIMVQMTSDVVDLAIGMQLAPITWAEMGGMITDHRIMTAQVPRIKYDANSHCGVLHATGL